VAVSPSATDALHPPASLRRRRIILSYATAGVAKGVAATVQLLALPVIAVTLGSERFGALLVLGAVGALCCLPARAIVPAASVGIARARGLNDPTRVTEEVRSAGLVSTVLGLIATAFVLAAAFLVDPTVLFGRDAAEVGTEVGTSVAALLVLIFATYFLAWVEGVRTGYEESHLNNLFSLLGSAGALAGIGAAWAYSPTIPAFFLAVYVLYPLLQGLNLVLLPRERWARRAGQRPDRAVVEGVLRRGLSWGIAQAGLVLHLQGSVYLAAHAFGLAAGALVGGVVRLLQIFHSLLLSLLNPVLPTLSHASAAGRGEWVQKNVRRAAAIIFVGLVALSVMTAWFGDEVVAGWLQLDVQPDFALFAAFGAMALFHMASQLYYLILLALGKGRQASFNLLWAGVAGVIAGFAAMQFYGLHGLLWGQALAMLAVAFVPIALTLFRRV
jgi:O-antigen/teichoic acid export membrane protein